LIEQAGEGVVVYLRQEGRGIGLINKLRAYSLQDGGLDTVEANERLGFPADLRNYGVGAQILSDLGVRRLRLITNNPRKIAGLGGYGLEVVDRVPLVIHAGDHNAAYLQAKRTKLGHLMEASSTAPLEVPGSWGPTAVLGWQGEAGAVELVERLEGLRGWLLEQGLLLEPEEHPRLLALLAQPRLALLLRSPEPRPLAPADLAAVLQRIASWPGGRAVSLLLAPDGRRVEHPSVDLEPEIRPLADLGATESSCPRLSVTPGGFVVWR
jgi:3,4-dihydroxy 2-butanone 4-phosphate synthase/GTP cyclohydrolase II